MFLYAKDPCEADIDNKGNITDADYSNAKRVCNDFKIKTLKVIMVIRILPIFVYSKQYIILS